MYKGSALSQQCQDWYLLYLPERSDKNVIIERSLTVHRIQINMIKTWSIWLNEHAEKKLLISSVRKAAPALSEHSETLLKPELQTIF